MTTHPAVFSVTKPVEILLVEDSRVDRMLAIEALREFRVLNTLHCVSDGEQAMAYLRRQGEYSEAARPDLVLLDLNLPRKDGREVLAEIKQDENLRHIPVVVLTTSSAEADLLEAYGAHANCFITKPIDLTQFGRVARSLENFWFEVVTLPPPTPPRVASLPPFPVALGADLATRCRVLLIEDSATDALLLEAALGESTAVRFVTERADRLSLALQRLQKSNYDVVVTDLNLPDSEGVDTLRAVCHAAGDTPVIVLTMNDDEHTGLELLREGAKDCLVKGELGGRALARAIRQAMDRGRMEARLRHAQRMESVGVLAGGVAHDFNNLLTVIKGNAELLVLRGLEPVSQAAAGQIVAAADRGASLTRQLLTFSRRDRLQPVPMELNRVVEEMAGMLGRLLGPAQRLELKLAEGALNLVADAGMISQVVMNLAINAREAMPDGGVLRIETTSATLAGEGGATLPPHGPGDYACILVADTGAGIPADVLPRIFEPFFTTKDAGRGTGLGLATVYGVAEQHGGLVEVKSELGRGTEFRVWLPLTAVEAGETRTVAPSRKKCGSGEVILLVDDEKMVLEMAALALRAHGYEVIEADDAEAALALWPQHGARVSLLLTDLLMPGMTGRELAERLVAKKSDLRVIYSSGYFSPGLMQELKLMDGVNFVAKPYSILALVETVFQALGTEA